MKNPANFKNFSWIARFLMKKMKSNKIKGSCKFFCFENCIKIFGKIFLTLFLSWRKKSKESFYQRYFFISQYWREGDLLKKESFEFITWYIYNDNNLMILYNPKRCEKGDLLLQLYKKTILLCSSYIHNSKSIQLVINWS